MGKICKHCMVYGKVQGVFFRRHTQEKALELGISGWVRNREDGVVETLICGDSNAVSKMETWLWQGPDAAKVSKVESRETDLEQIPSNLTTPFEILY